MTYEYAGVYLLDNPFFLDGNYDYYIPSDLRDAVCRGMLVSVPFGTSNRSSLGVVVSLKDEPDIKDISHKPIFSICNEKLTLSDELLRLCFFMKEQTLCTFGEAVRALIPASVISKLTEVFYPAQNADERLNELDAPTLLIFEYIKKRGSARFELLKGKFGPTTVASLRKLRECGAVFRTYELKDAEGKSQNCYSLRLQREDAEQILDSKNNKYRLRSPMHIEIVRALLSSDSTLTDDEIKARTGASSAQIKALVDKQILEKQSYEVDRSSIEEYISAPREISLSDEQRDALSVLLGLYSTGEPKAALLHGVTGSGKTCVIMKLIDKVLDDGKGVIMLLPEIALTPQTLGIFCSRYGNRVAVIHSALSQGERYDTYNKIKEGKADLVIGTRSAIFAPVKNLGLVVIDEEQEHTYKSDMNPKYHARDIARFRCAYNNALMLLASATPSLESYKKAEEGTYTLIKLHKRYGNAVLPKVIINDMRPEAQSGNTSPLGTLLCRKLVANKQKGGQSVLFLNRRGYNNFTSCRDCGEAVRCPTCSVSMTYHTVSGSYDSGELRCHWCGRKMPLPNECPSCHGTHLVRMGYGTQRVEQELSALMPEATILRMDTDTATTKAAYDAMLGKFRRHEADLLLGTQMVTKGHDFPDVTLVGVLLADSSLYLDDYRANERTFSTITQVIGRAGRGDKAGEAVIQTSNPENECIKLACSQDYEAFYASEIKLRKLLVFPPFCDISMITMTSADEKELLRASAIIAKELRDLCEKEYSDVPILTFGPFEAPVYKVENKYRMRLISKCRLNRRSRALFSEILTKFSKSSARTVTLSVDFNPSNI